MGFMNVAIGTKRDFTTSDNVRLVYHELFAGGGSRHDPEAPTLVLIHGWSGTGRYFNMGLGELATACNVYVPDLRGHGQSDKPGYGYHIARLAADLRDLLAAAALDKVVVVGTSMGASIIWSYYELFGKARLAGAVFVDQAPLQNRAPDWRLGSNGCYDAASLAALQTRLRYDFEGFAEDNGRSCMQTPPNAEIFDELKAETLTCCPKALAQLMADHTQLDWRPTIQTLKHLPCIVMLGKKSQCFPWEGVQEVSRLQYSNEVQFAVPFEEGDHWLYIEFSSRFVELLKAFSSMAARDTQIPDVLRPYVAKANRS